MSGIDVVGIHKTGDYLQGMQAAIKEKWSIAKQDETVLERFDFVLLNMTS